MKDENEALAVLSTEMLQVMDGIIPSSKDNSRLKKLSDLQVYSVLTLSLSSIVATWLPGTPYYWIAVLFGAYSLTLIIADHYKFADKINERKNR